MMITRFLMALSAVGTLSTQALSQNVLFTFDELPHYTPLPVTTVSEGVQATMSGQNQGYSIQDWGTVGIRPAGMGGRYIWPNSIFQADLYAQFSTDLTFFSIMYSPHELATDSSCRMRVTAYKDSTYVGTNTYQITQEPFTWPTGTLSITTTQPFNRVVVHYDAPPPTGGDYGVIFIADNMVVKPVGLASVQGTVQLQDYLPGSENVPIWVDLYQNGNYMESKSVILDAAGNYSFSTALTGSVQLRFIAEHWLTQLSAPPNLTLGSTVSIDADLVNGDIDADNSITIFDYLVLSTYFDKSILDADWWTFGDDGFAPYNADLDGDGANTIFDYLILSANFDQFGS